ncbi:MAG TPA: hypothetical protein PLX97_00495, partial [Gemmatales bacterium]|nr:hypothetical protein [Gemmatales bacterium]
YEGELIASLQRQPMYLTVWMVSRILNGESRDTRKWKAILRQVIRHPNASQDVKHDAEEYLDNHK